MSVVHGALGRARWILASVITVSLVAAAVAWAEAGDISTVAGGGTYGCDKPATEAAFAQDDLDVEPYRDGFLVVDSFRSIIVFVDDEGHLTCVAGNGTDGFSGDTGAATSAQLNKPAAVSATPDDGFLIADTGNHRIRKVDENGVITTVAGSATNGFAGDDGAATSAQLNRPFGVASNPDGSFLIADTLNHRIRKVSGGNITTVAGDGTATLDGDGGPAADASLREPRGVASLGNSDYLVADTGNYVVRRVTAGTIARVAGSGGFDDGGGSGDGGAATDATLSEPRYVIAGPDDSVIFSDHDNHRVRAVNSEGLIHTIAGNGSPSFGGDGGPATEAGIDRPAGLALMPSGDLLIGQYIAVRKVEAGFPLVPPDDGGGGGGGDDDGDGANGPANPNIPSDPPPPPPPPPSGKRPTRVQVMCTYVVATSSNTCTATVADAGVQPTEPVTGSVRFASRNGGVFSAGSTCSLTQTPFSPGIASCSVLYLAPTSPSITPQIVATYDGDGRHDGSQGTTQFLTLGGQTNYRTERPYQVKVDTNVPADGTSVNACAVAAPAAGRPRAAQTQSQRIASMQAQSQLVNQINREIQQAQAARHAAAQATTLDPTESSLVELQKAQEKLNEETRTAQNLMRARCDITRAAIRNLRKTRRKRVPAVTTVGRLRIGSARAGPLALNIRLNRRTVRRLAGRGMSINVLVRIGMLSPSEIVDGGWPTLSAVKIKVGRNGRLRR
jgi:hypothetical protein